MDYNISLKFSFDDEEKLTDVDIEKLLKGLFISPCISISNVKLIDTDIIDLVTLKASEKMLNNEEIIVKINTPLNTKEIKKHVDELGLMILDLIPDE